MAAKGDPLPAAFCHCQSCRTWHAAPFIGYFAWPEDKVAITGDVATSGVNAVSGRVSCARCGGALANRKPAWGLVVLYPTILTTAPFVPSLHLHYAERVLEIADGLPKYANAPERIGGDGTLLPEPRTTAWRSSL